jgi:hypothetical protein
MTPSPVNWLIVPSYLWISSMRILKQPSVISWISSGSSFSESEVKLATSAKRTVTSLRSPSIELLVVRIFSAKNLGV